MIDRGISSVVGGQAARLIDRLATRPPRRAWAALAGVAAIGSVPLVELHLAELDHSVHLLGFLVVAAGAALRMGPGSGAIVLVAGSIGCLAWAVQAPAAADVPGLAMRLVLYLIAGAAFLAVLQGSIRLQRQHPTRVPIARLDGGPVEQLTAREVEILRCAANGLDVSEMADHLYLSPNTVKTHLSHAYQKLGVGNRQAAIRAAIHCGCVSFADVCPHRSPATDGKITING